MNKTLKTGILLVLLAIPVLVFIFLKSFGVNHYTIPVYFTADTTVQVAGCPDFSLPHSVNLPPNLSSELPGRSSENFVFAVINGEEPTGQDFEKAGQLVRVINGIPGEKFRIVTFSNVDQDQFNQVFQSIYQPSDLWKVINTTKNLQDFINCELLMQGEETNFSYNQFVLVDQSGLIRGYYSGDDREEVDRLILELKILLRENEVAQVWQ